MTDFPSITFPATFEGTSAIDAGFAATLKFKPDDALKVLDDLRALPRGKYDITVVARQAQLAGDSVDREWSNMAMQADEEGEVEYKATCIGGKCPHFAVATEGDLEGAYVCKVDPDNPAKVADDGTTPCPLYPQAEEGAPIVRAFYPGEEHVRITDVGENTRFGELVADYLAVLPLGDQHKNDAIELYAVIDADADVARPLDAVIVPADYGLEFRVRSVADETPGRATRPPFDDDQSEEQAADVANPTDWADTAAENEVGESDIDEPTDE